MMWRAVALLLLWLLFICMYMYIDKLQHVVSLSLDKRADVNPLLLLGGQFDFCFMLLYPMDDCSKPTASLKFCECCLELLEKRQSVMC